MEQYDYSAVKGDNEDHEEEDDSHSTSNRPQKINTSRVLRHKY
jgi:hypothetical protein